MNLHFSKILRKRLGKENLSKVSDDLSIRRSLLQDWVHNDRTPSLSNIENVSKIANYLGLTLEELLVGVEDNPEIISSVSFKDQGREYRIRITREK